MQIYGEKALKWQQENPNYLTYLQEGQPMQTLKPGYDFHDAFARGDQIAPGHPEVSLIP